MRLPHKYTEQYEITLDSYAKSLNCIWIQLSYLEGKEDYLSANFKRNS
jgi:hypothetical protein